MLVKCAQPLQYFHLCLLSQGTAVKSANLLGFSVKLKRAGAELCQAQAKLALAKPAIAS